MSSEQKIRVEVPGPPVSVEITWEQVRVYLRARGWIQRQGSLDFEWQKGGALLAVLDGASDHGVAQRSIQCAVESIAALEQRRPADVLRDIAGLDSPRCNHCAEFGLRTKGGCIVTLWGEEEREELLSRDASVAAAREVLGTTAAEARADEIEAEVAKHGHPRSFDDALRYARYSRDGSQRAETPDARKRQQIDAAAWLIVAQRILAREAAR